MPQNRDGGELEEPRMVDIERTRRAAERLWEQIGLLLVRGPRSGGPASV
jgi:hypothetical protein